MLKIHIFVETRYIIRKLLTNYKIQMAGLMQEGLLEQG